MKPVSRRIGMGVVTAVAVITGIWLWIRQRETSYEAARAEAVKLYESGQTFQARKRLLGLRETHGTRPELAYWLGLCEAQAGRWDQAEAEWARVPADAPDGPAALLLRGRQHVQRRGQLSRAEELLRQALNKPGPHAGETADELARLFALEGRRAEAIATYERYLSELPDPLEALRAVYDLRRGNVLYEKMERFLRQALEISPADAQVKLALALVRIEAGDKAQSRALLEAASAGLGDHPSLDEAWLRWSLAFQDPEILRRSVEIMQLRGALEPDRALEVLAFLSRETGDAGGEARALAELVALRPDHSAALERLAELAGVNQPDRAASWRQRKAEVDRAQDRYKELVFLRDPSPHAGELAALAQTLGWEWESRHFAGQAGGRLLSQPRAPDMSEKQQLAADGAARAAAFQAGLERYARMLTARSRADRDQPAIAATPWPVFEDAASARGLTFQYEPGFRRVDEVLLPEMMGGGIGLIDYDRDGWLDIYLTQGGPFPRGSDAPVRCQDRLFRNVAGQRFEDVSETAGLTRLPGGYGMGVAVGDADNDGRPDLFITRYDSYLFLRNRGDGAFEDRTEAAGLGGAQVWPTSAAWGDIDHDGDLDLYVCHYLIWTDPNADPATPGGPLSTLQNPRRFPAVPDRLWRNDGGRFTDITAEAGITDPDGRGLGVVIADLDKDDRVDIYVANDMTANFLFHNLGGGRFEERAPLAGLAGNAEGGFQAGMGIALGDSNGDARPDLAVTNFYLEGTTLYENLGGGAFADRSRAAGLFTASRPLLGFGAVFFDGNNDGALDLATANGHIFPGQAGIPYEMPVQILRGSPSGRFEEVTGSSGDAVSRPRVGRALVAADLDQDGRTDLVLVSLDQPLALLQPVGHNSETRHAVWVELEGTASNRDGIGATVRVEAAGRILERVRFGGGSYQSSGDPRLHFGLGDQARIDRLMVRWPSGREELVENLPVDRVYRIREGTGAAAELRHIGQATPP